MTKLLLKESLIELMEDDPVGKITIKEICGNADVNRSTFYLHYRDQYELLQEIENELILEVQNHLEKIDSDYNSIQYLHELLLYIKNNADIFRILLCRQNNIGFQMTFSEVTLKNLQLNLALDCSASLSGYVYTYLITGSTAVIKQWIESGFDLSHQDIANLIYRLSGKAASPFS